MPPQIKQDLNRSGWETTDLPSVCERCLGPNKFTQLLKEDYGAECKLCTRPYTVFRWKADRTSRQKRTAICLTCARMKNCCQCCMLDLSFGLPITIRDAALKMIAPGPQSDVNREFYAQNNEREIEEGRGLEGYEKTDEKARDLLKRLAASEPYYKKQRRLEAEEAEEAGKQKLIEAGSATEGGHKPGPIRTTSTRPSSQYGSAYGLPRNSNPNSKQNRGPGRGGKGPTSSSAPPLQPRDILPPADKNVTSLFVTGIEDDLPEHEIRAYFQQFGAIRSLVCSHRSHCAFVNYMTRDIAETAAEACQGKALVKGVPLRVQWGKPKPLDNLDRDQRMQNARAGRENSNATRSNGQSSSSSGPTASGAVDEMDQLAVLAPPPGEDDVEYAALAGD